MNQPSAPIRLLAIDPRTRYIGLAVFEGTRLLDWRVRRATTPQQRRGAARGQRIETILRPILQRYHPQILVLKRRSTSQRGQSRMASMLTKHFTAVGQQQGLRVLTYTPAQVRQFMARGQQVTRLELARILATEHYPFLAPRYEQELRTPWYRERYYLRMFFAIALGRCALSGLQQRPGGDET
jgi:Holliday junction resolvasome RuvABC endonuclease subunit